MIQHPACQNTYVSILISEVRSSSRQLYPLTKNYPMSLLSVGSKKLIVYQLQALGKLTNMSKIIIVVEDDNDKVQEYIERVFLQNRKQYPITIQFFRTKDISNTYLAFQAAVQSLTLTYKGYLLILCDTINSVALSQFLAFHQNKKSDMSLLAKAKKDFGQQQKKMSQGQIETDIDNVLIGDKSELLFIDMADEVDNNGVKINPSIFKRVKRAVFRKIVDSKIYLFNDHMISIIKNLSNDEIYDIKPWLIQLIVENQTNKTFLKLNQQKEILQPLKVNIFLNDQDTYIKKINSKKIYQNLNYDSVIRGPKQKEILMPTIYSDLLDERKQYKGNASVAQTAVIGTNVKIRRSIVGPGCKLGKNVELLNAIILQNTEIKDNCKISDSIISSNNIIGEGVIIKNSYTSINCRIADGLKVDSETLISNQ